MASVMPTREPGVQDVDVRMQLPLTHRAMLRVPNDPLVHGQKKPRDGRRQCDGTANARNQAKAGNVPLISLLTICRSAIDITTLLWRA